MPKIDSCDFVIDYGPVLERSALQDFRDRHDVLRRHLLLVRLADENRGERQERQVSHCYARSHKRSS
jgi:hypothetical protein